MRIILFLLCFLIATPALATPVTTLFENQTSNGNSSSYTFAIQTGLAQAIMYGTWDGATAKLQFQANDGSTWIDYDSVSCTADCSVAFRESISVPIRAVISSAGASTSLTVDIDNLNN